MVIEECSLAALCDFSCPGRLVGRGLALALQVFPVRRHARSNQSNGGLFNEEFPSASNAPSYISDHENWGVRTTVGEKTVPRGAFVVEFIGRISPMLRTDIQRAVDACDKRVVLVKEWVPGSEFCMDARSIGNIARFIRVADCKKGEKPNLMKQVIAINYHLFAYCFLTKIKFHTLYTFAM